MKISKVFCFLALAMFSIQSAGFQTDNEETDLAGSASYSGRATALGISIAGITTVVGDTGALSSQGGSLETSLLETSVPLATLGVVSLEVLHAAVIGQGNHTSSESSFAGLNLTLGLNSIRAGLLMARATASCGVTLKGSSEVLGLVINGTPIVITGQPNQTVNLIAGKIIINEQTTLSAGSSGAITVNALHIIVPGVADIVLSSASAGINCRGTPSCKGKDFVTGGGYIDVGNNQKGNFGVAGGSQNNGTWGHLTFIDHNTGMKVKGTGVTSYTILDATTRKITGTAKIDNSDGFSYVVTVSDKGEPGVNDTFRLQLSNGYDTATQLLAGGNVQLHKPCN